MWSLWKPRSSKCKGEGYKAQVNMIKNQLRTWHLPSDAVLEVAAEVPRSFFVPKSFESLAFTDIRIPLAHQQFMLTPKEEIWMLDALSLEPTDHVLEIGTGSGYFTALLSKMALYVDSIDIFPDFIEEARRKLDSLNIRNVALLTQDALSLETTIAYNAVVFTGSLPFLANRFRTMVVKGGCLLAILGTSPVMTAMRLEYTQDRTWWETRLFETMVEPLIHAPSGTPFKF